MPGNEQAQPRFQETDNSVLKLLNQTEQTYRDSSYWPQSMIKPYNPDDLVRARYDYSIYEDMMKDDQVSVCMQLKKDLVLGSGYEIFCEQSDEEQEKQEPKEEPEEDLEEEDPEESEDPADGWDDAQEEIRKDLECRIQEDPDMDFDQSLEEMLSAYEYGFSISEPLFKHKDDGSITLKSIKARHPTTWLLHTDEFGNMKRYEQRGPKTSIDVPAEALIHYINQSRFQNPYGQSDLRACYTAWKIKLEIVKYYAIFLEGKASPKAVAKYDKNAPQSAVDAVYNAIKSFHTKTAMAVPKEIELMFLECKSEGEVYIKGINLFNMFIGRALLIPDLLGFQGGETSGGSYSLGKDQMDVLFKHIGKRRKELEKIINRRIIKPMCKYNHGEMEKFPKFRFKPIKDDDALELAKVWVSAAGGKIYKASDEEINHFRRLCKFPEGAIERPDPPPMLPGVNPQGGNPPNKGPQDNGNAGGDQDPKEQDPKDKDQPAGEKEKQYKQEHDAHPFAYSRKVDFKAIENAMDRMKASVLADCEPVLEAMFANLSDQIRKKKIVQSQDIGKLDSLTLKGLPKLRQVLKKKFAEAHQEAKRQAYKEIHKGAQYKAPLPNDAFMKFLEEETFQYIGDFEYQVKKGVRAKIVEAIKSGKPVSSVTGILSEEGMELSEASLERYARTKFTEVMNRGRMEFFEESGVVAAYQYSAVMDDRTSEICSGLHGKVFAKDDAPIPPMHFNCRSVLIPITKYEDWKADKSVDGKNIDKFIDDNKGEGFSKYTLKGLYSHFGYRFKEE